MIVSICSFQTGVEWEVSRHRSFIPLVQAPMTGEGSPGPDELRTGGHTLNRGLRQTSSMDPQPGVTWPRWNASTGHRV